MSFHAWFLSVLLLQLRTRAWKEWSLSLWIRRCYGSRQLLALLQPTCLSFLHQGISWLLQRSKHLLARRLCWTVDDKLRQRRPLSISNCIIPWRDHCQTALCCPLWSPSVPQTAKCCFAQKTSWLRWRLCWRGFGSNYLVKYSTATSAY
jgi:hypothetical protein